MISRRLSLAVIADNGVALSFWHSRVLPSAVLTLSSVWRRLAMASAGGEENISFVFFLRYRLGPLVRTQMRMETPFAKMMRKACAKFGADTWKTQFRLHNPNGRILLGNETPRSVGMQPGNIIEIMNLPFVAFASSEKKQEPVVSVKPTVPIPTSNPQSSSSSHAEGVFAKDWLRRQAERQDAVVQRYRSSEGMVHAGWSTYSTSSDWHAAASMHEELDIMRKAAVQPAGFSPERHAYYIRGRPVVVFCI